MPRWKIKKFGWFREKPWGVIRTASGQNELISWFPTLESAMNYCTANKEELLRCLSPRIPLPKGFVALCSQWNPNLVDWVYLTTHRIGDTNCMTPTARR